MASTYDVAGSRNDFSGRATDGFKGWVPLSQERMTGPRFPFAYLKS